MAFAVLCATLLELLSAIPSAVPWTFHMEWDNKLVMFDAGAMISSTGLWLAIATELRRSALAFG